MPVVLFTEFESQLNAREGFWGMHTVDGTRTLNYQARLSIDSVTGLQATSSSWRVVSGACA